MAGFQFNNPLEKLAERAQSEGSSLPGQRVSLFTGHAVPAFQLNIAPPTAAFSPQAQAASVPSLTLPTESASESAPPHPLAETAYPNPDVSGLYPDEASGLLDLGGNVHTAPTAGNPATEPEAFYVAPTPQPVASDPTDLDAMGAMFDPNADSDHLLTLGQPLLDAYDDEASSDTFGDFNTAADTHGVPMVDLSTGNVVDLPSEAIDEPLTSAPIQEFPDVNYIDDTDPPFELTHDAHGGSFEPVSMDDAGGFFQPASATETYDPNPTLDEDDFLAQDATPIHPFTDEAHVPAPASNADFWANETPAESPEAGLFQSQATEGYGPATDNGADFGMDFLSSDTHTPNNAAPLDEVWGLDEFSSPSAPGIEDATISAFDDFGDFSVPNTMAFTQENTSLEPSEADTLFYAEPSPSYLEAPEHVPLTSEDVAEFYPQHHELTEHGEPSSSVVLPPDTPPLPLHSTLTTDAVLAQQEFFGSNTAPLDDLDVFSTDDDDDSWSLDTVPSELAQAPEENDYHSLPLSPAEAEHPISGAWDATEEENDITPAPDPEPGIAINEGFSFDDSDDMDSDWSLDTPEDSADIASGPYPDEPNDNELSAPYFGADTTSDVPASVEELTPHSPEADTTHPAATEAVLHQHPIHMQLCLSLTPNAAHPDNHVDLWAENPSTGDRLLLKTLPLNLLPSPLSRMAVTTEARLKDKTIYRVDLVRWKGLFSQDVHGTLAFRDELIPAQPKR